MNVADWILYANQGATRSQPLSDDLVQTLSYLPELGLQAEVFSGGQPTAGNGPRVGSVRHDHGNAADLFLRKDGQRLDWANPQHQPIFEQVVQRGRAAGLTGFGAGEGYMQPGSMHVGFGNPAVWGAGGKGENAPDWLRRAFGAAPSGGGAPATPGPAQTPNGNTLTFGSAVPDAPPIAPGIAGMFDPRLANAGLDLGAPVFGAPQAPAAMQMAEQEKRRTEQDRRISLADLIRY